MSPDPTAAGPEPVTIDLDAARQARREASGIERAEVKLSGKRYPLPIELPAVCVHAFGELVAMDPDPKKMDPRAMVLLGQGIEAIFGGQWDTITGDASAAGDPLSLQDEVELLEHVLEIYGITLPESSPSGSS